LGRPGAGSEDAIDLADEFSRHANADVAEVLQGYEARRSVEVLKIQNAARNSTEWFENVNRYTGMEVEQFAYSLLTRSQRISHENLRLRDAKWLEGYEAWLQTQAQPGVPVKKHPTPPMLLPLTVRGLTLKNRIVVSPMAQYSAVDGVVGDYHLVHLGARAMGGAALVMVEMTSPTPEGRITPGCPGLWNEAQQAGLKRIVDFVHGHSSAKIGLQLGHSGAKGSTQLGWEQIDEPLPSGNWPLLSASAVPYGEQNQVPRAMTRADMDAMTAAFVASTQRAAEAGFDWLELHAAHGYLLSSFITPLTNQRTDDYGGSLANRCRYPLEVFTAMRAAWPADKPFSVRISAHDWAPGGNTPDDAVEIARLFKAAGCDLIDVSSARPRARPSRCTAACTRRRSPTACATRPASSPWRWARSPKPTTPTASSRPAAPTSAPWRARTWPTRPGRCTKPPSCRPAPSNGRAPTRAGATSSTARSPASKPSTPQHHDPSFTTRPRSPRPQRTRAGAAPVAAAADLLATDREARARRPARAVRHHAAALRPHGPARTPPRRA
jgi:2,4-dienoyl-CoA reductase-like NADH-dependent reductase (Old Yellow Enzyme family)